MFSISSIKRVRDALIVLAVGLFGFAQADGPVSVANLPGGGGIVVSDTDITEGGGLGQRWGRAGGRTITYHVNSPASMSALRFSVIQASTPSTAFDGAVTNGSPENMTFNSMPAANQARWTGSAILPLAVAPFSVQLATRFTMTVTTSGGSPIPLAVGPDGIYPAASVLSTGDFKVNLLFEMQDLDLSQTFHPTLDYYDAQATPAGALPNTNTGPVMTGVSTGFYYALAAPTGMTLEEHDAHLTSLFAGVTPKIDNMNGKINFINEDWPLRWNAISADVFDAKTSINNNINGPGGVMPTLTQIQSQVGQLLGQGGNNNNLATKNDVQQAKDNITGILTIMVGMAPCPVPDAGQAFCDDFKSMRQMGAATNQIQSSLDGILIGLNQPTWLAGVQGTLGTLATHNDVSGILIGLNQPTWLAGVQGTLGTLATHNDVNGILIGLNNALAGAATQSSVNALDTKVTGLSAKIDALQGALDSVGSSQLDMIIGPVDTQGSKQARFIVKVSRDGELVPAVITGVATIRTAKGAGAYANVMGNTTIVTLAPGLYDVTINLVKDVSDGSLFVFQASSTLGGGTFFGNAMAAPFK